jgi:hypothetical protein
MKKILYFSVFLSGLVFVQNGASAQSRFTLSATVAPFYQHSKTSQTFILPTPAGGNYDTKIKSKMTGVGYWAGVNAGYALTSRWSLATGFWFTHVNLNKPVITSAPTLVILSGKGKSHNFLVPLQINYQTSSGKLSPYFSAGALFNFKSVTKINFSEGNTGNFVDKKMKIAPMVGAGVIYHFAEHLSLIAQPIFSYTATGMETGSQAYRVCLNAQIMYKF